eukprot:6005021-Pyramimonas_sp.AAC.1
MAKSTDATGEVSTIETVDRSNGVRVSTQVMMLIALIVGGLIFYADLRVGYVIEKADAILGLKKDGPPISVSSKGCVQGPRRYDSPGGCPICSTMHADDLAINAIRSRLCKPRCDTSGSKLVLIERLKAGSLVALA